jgi:hypothetical protein
MPELVRIEIRTVAATGALLVGIGGVSGLDSLPAKAGPLADCDDSRSIVRHVRSASRSVRLASRRFAVLAAQESDLTLVQQQSASSLDCLFCLAPDSSRSALPPAVSSVPFLASCKSGRLVASLERQAFT